MIYGGPTRERPWARYWHFDVFLTEFIAYASKLLPSLDLLRQHWLASQLRRVGKAARLTGLGFQQTWAHQHLSDLACSLTGKQAIEIIHKFGHLEMA